MRLFIISLLTSVLLFSCEKKIEDPLKSLQEKKLHTLNLNLYPSNLKMINTNENPDFAEATKGIRKLHVLQLQLDDEEKKAEFAEWKSKQDFMEWESIFQARIDDVNIEVRAPQGRDDILYASADMKDGMFLGFLEGEFDISKIPALMKSDMNLGPVNDFLLDKDKKKAQREKMKKIRKEIEEEEGKEDSIASGS